MKMNRFSDLALREVKDIAAHWGYIIRRQGECFLRLLFVPVLGCIEKIDDWSEVCEASAWGFPPYFSVMNMETNEFPSRLVMHDDGNVDDCIWIILPILESLDRNCPFI